MCRGALKFGSRSVVNFSGLLLAEKLIGNDSLIVGGLGDSYDFDLSHPTI